MPWFRKEKLKNKNALYYFNKKIKSNSTKWLHVYHDYNELWGDTTAAKSHGKRKHKKCTYLEVQSKTWSHLKKGQDANMDKENSNFSYVLTLGNRN